MAAKKAPAKKQGKGKAYAPVPKGYKANWNVPKGTPWKKNSPYNPANSPAAKKAAAEKAVTKKTANTKVKPSAKKVSSKKPVIGKDGLTRYQRELSVPMEKRSVSSKQKLKPYDAKWRADIKKNNDRYNNAWYGRKMEAVLNNFTPLGGIVYAAEAATGKNLHEGYKSKKKVNRLGAAANAAFALGSFGAAGKSAKKTAQALKGAKEAQKMLSKKTLKAKATGQVSYDAYVNQMVAKEIAKMKRQINKGNK